MKRELRERLFRLSVILFIVPFSINLSAQDDKIDSILDSMFFGTDDEILLMLAEMNKNHHFVYSRFGYDSKTVYAGREIGTDQYNVSGQLYYLNSLGFSLGVSGAWYSQMDPSYRSTIVSAGYSRGLKKIKNLRYRISYSRYFYNTYYSIYEPVFNSSASAGLTIKMGSVGTRFDYSLLMGNDFGSQVSSDIYCDLSLFKVGKKLEISVLPEISFYFGSETVENERISYLASMDGSTMVTDYSYEDRFGLMNTQLILPLEISIGDFDIEISYSYNINRSIDPDYTFDNVSMFSISAGYFFVLN